MSPPNTRVAAGDAPETQPLPALTNDPTPPHLLDNLEWLALNDDQGRFEDVAAALIPGFSESTWGEYAQAVQDLWDLHTGKDPYLFSDADPKLFCAADVRAFEIDQREERRDAALAQLLDAIRTAAPDRETP